MIEKPTFFHKSVLVDQVIEFLKPEPNKLYIDATFGSGGHTKAILEADPTCRVIAIDWDKESLDKYGPLIEEKFGNRFSYIWGNFAHLYKIIKEKNIGPIDGILADFGTSQMQIMERDGFSFMQDKPLDMRMSFAHHKKSAAIVIKCATEKTLKNIFEKYGEERLAGQFARAIVEQRKIKPIKTTFQLATLIKKIAPKQKNYRIHPATRVFQALRIYVNHELDNIHSFLAGAVPALAPGGKIVCISFHSLEDRIVKHFFQKESKENIVQILTKTPIMATDEEIKTNNSARSAKLRAALKK